MQLLLFNLEVCEALGDESLELLLEALPPFLDFLYAVLTDIFLLFQQKPSSDSRPGLAIDQHVEPDLATGFQGLVQHPRLFLEGSPSQLLDTLVFLGDLGLEGVAAGGDLVGELLVHGLEGEDGVLHGGPQGQEELPCFLQLVGSFIRIDIR